MSKRPTDHLEPAAKKRGNERQLTKDDASDDEEQTVDPSNFDRASEDVIKQRKIVKARRGADAGGGGSGKANPFAGIQLAATTAPAAAQPFSGVAPFGAASTSAPAPALDAKPAAAAQPAAAPAASDTPAQTGSGNGVQPSDQKAEGAAGEQQEADVKPSGGGFGAFGSGTGSGLAFGFGSASGGFGSLAGASSSAAFSFGAASAASGSSGSIFAFSSTAAPTFSFAAGSSAASASGDAAPASAPAGGSEAAAAPPSLFGSAPASGTPLFGAAPPPVAKVSLPGEQAVTTGEEDEHTVFSGEGALFEFDASKQWRERGRGEMRVNAAPSGQARLVMRQKGNLRLLMNANLWGEMQVSKMEGGKGATFACVNAVVPGDEAGAAKEDDAAAATVTGGDAASQLSTFALRIKLPEVLDQFVAAVNAHKAGGKRQAAADP